MRIDLSHLKSCDQRWDRMEPSGPGQRRCSRCQKQIIDFRGMSDDEIALRHLESEAPVCGLYSPAQLVPLGARPSIPSGSRLPLPIALSAWLLGSTAAAAQEPAAPQGGYATLPAGRIAPPPAGAPDREQEEAPPTAADTLVVRGTVRDSASGRPLQGALIAARGTPFRAATNASGEYTLRIHHEAGEKRTQTIVFMLLGFARREVPVPEGAASVLDVALSPEPLQGEWFAVAAYRPSLWSRLRDAVGSLF